MPNLYVSYLLKPVMLLAVVLLPFTLKAQSLIEDGQRLLDALKIVRDTTLDNETRFSAARQAVLILYLYNEPGQNRAPGAIDVKNLLNEVKSNPLLVGLFRLKEDSLLEVAGASRTWEEEWARMQTQGRTYINTLMYGEETISPLQYLSIQQSIKNSQLPPLQNEAFLHKAVARLNEPPSGTSLSTEALLQGLFNFILERAQQEVVVTFFSNLLHKKIPQFGWLFPNVRNRFNSIDIHYSQSFLEGLREAFFLDLRNLNVALPELLLQDEYFSELQRDPVFYNFLMIYTVFGLSTQGIPIWQSMPIAYRNLYENSREAERKMNVRLAESAFISPEYARVQDATKAYVHQLHRVFIPLLDIQDDCESRINRLQERYGGENIPPRPIFPANQLYDFNLLNSGAGANLFSVRFLPQLLQGYIDDEMLIMYNTLPSYDKLFADLYSGRDMRVAGLEMVRKITGDSWFKGINHIDILRRWQTDLSKYIQEIDRWQMLFDTLDLAGRFRETDNQRAVLADVIRETRRHWQGGDTAHLQALVLLGAIAADFDDIIPVDLSYQDSVRMLRERQEKLFQLEKRRAAVEQRLAAKNITDVAHSPYQQYLSRWSVVNRPVDDMIVDIKRLETRSDTLRSVLRALEEKHAGNELEAWRASRPLIQATETLAHIFWILLKPDGEGLLNLTEMDSVFYQTPQLQNLCLGLLQQRLSHVKNSGIISSKGIAQFTRQTLQDLQELRSGMVDSTGKKIAPYGSLFKVTTVCLRTFNRTLEFPLLADPDKPNTGISLISQFPELQQIPAITEYFMNFLYYIEIGDYKPAISSMIRLLSEMSKQLNDRKDRIFDSGGKRYLVVKMPQRKNAGIKSDAMTDKRSLLLQFLEEYGPFIADLVEASTPAEAKDLLTGLADAPGSSKTKRMKKISIGINAYLGALGGSEIWEAGEGGQSVNSRVGILAPTMPVGFSISALTGTGKHPQSFSLFLSVLDLGAMLTYRRGVMDDFGEYKLTFKNVLKPGVQLHWNIQKTPFYLGLGVQSGALFREKDGKEIVLRSTRFFFSAGVDVPILTIFKK